MSLPPHHHITGGHLRQEPPEWPQNATGNGQAPTGTSHNFPHPSGHQHATAAHYQYNSTIGTNIHPSPVVQQRFTTYNYNSSCLPPPPPTALMLILSTLEHILYLPVHVRDTLIQIINIKIMITIIIIIIICPMHQ